MFILDCCYASAAGTRAAIQGSKEVLAACSMEDGTTDVADNSFTRNIIDELRLSVRANLTTWKLNKRMFDRRSKGRLEYTPRHFPLSDGDTPCICLRPLVRDSKLSTRPATPDLTDSTSLTSTDDSLGSEDRFSHVNPSRRLDTTTLSRTIAEVDHRASSRQHKSYQLFVPTDSGAR